jgi:hypothetical protein
MNYGIGPVATITPKKEECWKVSNLLVIVYDKNFPIPLPVILSNKVL